MNKSELIFFLKNQFPFLKTTQVSTIIESVFNNISNALRDGNRIEIRGLGSFSIKRRKVQASFFKEENKEVSLKEKNTIYFRMGKEFFKQINNE
ncbi:MAG: HU family DNA-binding protein [Pseudomonadota bacterium]